jgi:hypothetical protein
MKVHVKVSGSAGGFFGSGGSQTVETKISVSEHIDADTAALTDLVGALTVSATTIADAIIHHDEPVTDGDDESVGMTGCDDCEPGDEPDEKPTRPQTWTPGDAVRVTFADRSSRLFIDSGDGYFSPAVAGLFDSPISLAYNAPEISAVTPVATLGDSLGG